MSENKTLKDEIIIKKWLKYIIPIGVGIYIIPITIYFLFYGSGSFSNKIDDWSGFGDFIGGSLGSFFSLVNIAVFIVISLMLYNYSKRTENRNLLNQKIIILSQYRNEAIIDIEKKLRKIDEIQKTKNIKLIFEISEELKSIDNYIHLFGDHKVEFEKIKSKVEEISKSYFSSTLPLLTEHLPESSFNYYSLISDLQIIKNEFIIKLRNFVIEKLFKEELDINFK
jgi:hypothetical protein